MNKKKLLIIITIICVISLFNIDIVNAATCTEECDDLAPIIWMVKHGLIPIFQIIIPIGLIVFGMIDLAKAVIASKEEEMKRSQSMLIKRVIYALATFFVVTIVTIVFNMFGQAGITEQEVSGTTNWLTCYNNVEKCPSRK